MMFRKYSSDPKSRRGACPVFSRGEANISRRHRRQHQVQEADTLARVGVDELPNAPPQDGANKDVRVENDHFSGMRPSRGDAVP